MDLKRDTKAEIMKKPKHGRLYRVNLNGVIVMHRASAPGEAPANLTGALKTSIGFNTVGANRLEFGVRQAFSRSGSMTTVNYGRPLELGATAANLLPRPFLLPAIVKNENKILVHFSDQIEISIKENKVND